MQEQVRNLKHAELMQQLDRMNACHKADNWLAQHKYDLRGALINLVLDSWSHWLFKQLRRDDAFEIGIPPSWIEAVQRMDAYVAQEEAVLRASYLENNHQPNWDGFNAALDAMKRHWHSELREWLISTIVDEEDTQ